MIRPAFVLKLFTLLCATIICIFALLHQYDYTNSKLASLVSDEIKTESKAAEIMKAVEEIEKNLNNYSTTPVFRNRSLSIWNSDFVDYKKEKNLTTKYILFWTDFCGFQWWGLGGENITSENCIFTHKKDYFEHPHQYDAVIFHGAAVWKPTDVPKTRSPHQLYFMYTHE
jgi:hypothetical protein